MKYSKETLKKLKQLFEEFSSIELEERAQVKQRLTAQSNNDQIQDLHRVAAEQMSSYVNNLETSQNSARTWAERLGEYLNSNIDYPNGWTEDDLDRFIQTIQTRANNLSEEATNYLVRENNDVAPDPNDKIWKIVPYAGKLQQTADRIGIVQKTNVVDEYLEAQQAFDDEMSYLTAMSSSNLEFDDQSEVSLTNLADALDDARNRLATVNRELNSMVNGRDRWKGMYEDAARREAEAKQKRETLQTSRDIIRKDNEKAPRDQEKIEELRRQYHQNQSRVEAAERMVAGSDTELRTAKKTAQDLHKTATNYEKNLANVTTFRDYANEEQRKQLAEYAVDKEAEVRWGKAEAYTQELLDTVMTNEPDTPMVLTVLFGRPAVKEKKGFLGFGKRERVIGYPRGALETWEAQLTEKQKEKLKKGRWLIDHIQTSMPDTDKARELMDMPFGTDGREFARNLKAKLAEERAKAQKKLEESPVYQKTKELRTEQEAAQLLYRNQEELVHTAKNEDARLNYLESVKKLGEQLAETNMNIHMNPMNADMVDRVIEDHMNEELALSQADADLERITRENAYVHEHLAELKENQKDLQRKAAKIADPTYREMKGGEDAVIEEEERKAAEEKDNKKDKKDKKNQAQQEVKPIKKPSEDYLDQLLQQEEMKGESFFDRMKEKRQSTLETQKANLSATAEQFHKLSSEEASARRDKEKYSFTNYKSELERKSLEADMLQRKVNKYSAMKTHLDKAMQKYNTRTQQVVASGQALDDTKKKILDRINEFKAKVDKNKKKDHTDKSEYQALKARLEEFTEDSVARMSPAELSDKLKNLGDAAQTYEDAKARQVMHIFPSSQRIFRRALAKDIKSFADSHKATLDGMKISTALWNEIQSAKTDPPQAINNSRTFAETADALKANYSDKVKKFTDITAGIRTAYRENLLGANENQRKEIIADALASQELGKKVFDFNPAFKTLDAHVLELEQQKETLKNEVKRRYSGMIEQIAKEGEKENDQYYNNKLDQKDATTGKDIASRRNDFDVQQKYRNIEPYGPEAQNQMQQNPVRQSQPKIRNNVMV